MKENNFGSGQVIFIFDNKGISFAHLKNVTPALVKQIITIAESAIPVRIKSASTYNIPPFAERVFNLFKMFAKNKLADRVCQIVLLMFYRTFFDISNPFSDQFL